MFRVAQQECFKAKLRPSQIKKFCGQQARLKSGLGFVDSKGVAEEAVYFRKADDELMRQLLMNHPEVNPRFEITDSEQGMSKIRKLIMSVCKSHKLNVTDDFLKDMEQAVLLSTTHTHQARSRSYGEFYPDAF
eukprot:Platyproteum_vivax@DN6203_c0_g1_i1.p1